MRRPLHVSLAVLVSIAAAATASAQGLIELAEYSAEPLSGGPSYYSPAASWLAPPPVPAAPAMYAPPMAQAPEGYAIDAAAPGLPDACDEGCCFDFDICRIPCRYFQADALFWHRVGTGCNDVVVIDTDNDAPLAETGDLNFNLAPGMRFLVGWQPNPCHGCQHCCAWELSYFGIFDWNADADIAGGGDLAIPGDLGLAGNNFFGADEIGLRYGAEMHNLELNCIKSCCLNPCTRLDFLAGFRYISLDEDFSLIATDLQEGTSSYDINTDNDLFGVQLGGRATHSLCRWAVELTGKAGVFYNDAHGRQLVTDFPDTTTPFVLRDAHADGDGVALMGELGVVFIRPINDCWSFRVGYSMFGLGGVALAPDQLDFTDTFESGTELENFGWFFAHGGLAGFQASW